MGTKADVAAIAYQAIHGQLGTLMSYEDKLRYVLDVIDILQGMAETEYKKHIDQQSKNESKVVE